MLNSSQTKIKGEAMKKLIFVLVSFFISSSLYSQGVSVGKYSGEFLAIGVSGRALGMGSAFVALANDVSAGYWNPAGLSRLDFPQAMIMHDERFAGLVNYNYGALAIPYKSDMTLGFSVIRLGVDGIPDTRNALVDLMVISNLMITSFLITQRLLNLIMLIGLFCFLLQRDITRIFLMELI